MRSIGYINASINEVSKYYSKNNSYIHYLARKHPALVDFKHLDKVSKQLSIITNQKVDLKESDYMIIEFIYESIKL